MLKTIGKKKLVKLYIRQSLHYRIEKRGANHHRLLNHRIYCIETMVYVTGWITSAQANRLWYKLCTEDR